MDVDKICEILLLSNIYIYTHRQTSLYFVGGEVVYGMETFYMYETRDNFLCMKKGRIRLHYTTSNKISDYKSKSNIENLKTAS